MAIYKVSFTCLSCLLILSPLDKIKERTGEIEQLLMEHSNPTEDSASNEPKDQPTTQPIQIESDVSFKRERFESDSDISDQEE